MSPHSLPHPVSRPSTSSHTNQQSALGVVSQQQVRRPHHDDSPSGSPDQPRLYQPEIRRVALLSPDLQLQSSPHHQNTNIYPSQATSKWASQQAMSSSAHHFRSSHTASSTCSPTQSLRLTDLSINPLPHPQPIYAHELSPWFQPHHGPSPQVESSSRRSENSLRERLHQPLSHELEQLPQTGFSTDHLASGQDHFAQSLP
ncbi:hypothetical protein PCANC_18593 [Puccinia coronata f. sp. avenae]|uniref:Uncharacterized protein n=1 Tax=Puccinia coronata f. sp. avenae TaxID=200324 RepID=A0A2N5RWM7_9BASI|nr:hypothetical protein PCANC_25120 [Puccinia coronata f. sp. avenae]PLW26700.1 hypothetical protein PCANC_18593 [Puccinia coronata f. sp. avenae]